MKSDFLIAITQLAAERSLPRDIVLTAVEAALISAFKKDHLAEMDLAVRISGTTGDVHVFAKRTVVADELFENDKIHLKLDQAKALKADAKIGDVLEEEVTPANAGRIAAQTAKQVVMQRLREAERDLVYAEYAGKEGEIVSAVVQRFEARSVILDLGRAEAVMPPAEQVPHERYRNGMRIKVLILEVGKTAKGPQIVVSRTHKNLLKKLFELEVPEIFNGVVQIKAIAREAGFRSKVAVQALQERVDPVGSCVGLRGVRIQNIVNELHGEKIDVLEWLADPAGFIARALSPAQVMQVIPRADTNTAIVVVPDKMLSLAIGREGQNARLAAKLTGWRIDIKSTTEVDPTKLAAMMPPAPAKVAAPPAEIAERAAAAKPITPAPAAPTPEPAPVASIEPQPETQPAAPTQEAPAEDAPTLAEALAREETWKVPLPTTQRSAIRFAEDIMERPRGGGGRGKGRRGPDRDDAPAKKAKKERTGPVQYEPEEPA